MIATGIVVKVPDAVQIVGIFYLGYCSIQSTGTVHASSADPLP